MDPFKFVDGTMTASQLMAALAIYAGFRLIEWVSKLVWNKWQESKRPNSHDKEVWLKFTRNFFNKDVLDFLEDQDFLTNSSSSMEKHKAVNFFDLLGLNNGTKFDDYLLDERLNTDFVDLKESIKLLVENMELKYVDLADTQIWYSPHDNLDKSSRSIKGKELNDLKEGVFKKYLNLNAKIIKLFNEKI
jgi:hypothetical protein